MSKLLHQANMICLVLAAPAWAQFGEMAATDDGKQLFFTSRMLMKGGQVSSPRPESRLYQHGAAGVRLAAERGVLAPPSSFTSADGVARPSVSGNGSVIGFTLNNVCRAPANCAEVLNSRAEVRGRETVDLGEGIVQISRDGLWALVINEVYDYSQPQVINISTTTALVELSTGIRTTPPGPPYVDGHPSWFTLASDGAVLSVLPDMTAPPGIGG